jgi:glyoxylase-like metal-dependent hydrolase (beta-lactamase superfamily II)
MCNSCSHHHHGAFERATLGRYAAIGRRAFLARAGRGTFALLAEAARGRGVITIALGSFGTAACAAAPPASQQPATDALTASPSDTVAAATAGAPTATATTEAAATNTAMPEPTQAAPAAATPIGAEPLSYNQVNMGFVNAYVLVRRNEVAIVDTGVANSEDKIGEVLKAAGRDWSDVRHVILTHFHPDHAGSMNAVMAASSNAVAYAGAMDIPMIKTAVTIKSVADGDDVFGLQIIATPGHTPGHVSVYDPVGSAFITGDAIGNTGGTLTGPNPRFSIDMPTALNSVRKIAALSFETAYFMHGETITVGASAAIAALAKTL